MKPLSRHLLVAGAVLSVPATLFALTDTFFQISNYGLIGPGSHVGGVATFAVGANNVVGYGSASVATNAAAIGYSLRTNTSNSLMVGSWNAEVAGALFIVGNGTGSSLRKNAFEVLQSGTVNIPGTANIGAVPERGGISMGVYTVP